MDSVSIPSQTGKRGSAIPAAVATPDRASLLASIRSVGGSSALRHVAEVEQTAVKKPGLGTLTEESAQGKEPDLAASLAAALLTRKQVLSTESGKC